MATSALANWRDCLLGLERAFLAVSDSSIPDIGHARSAACSALKGAIRKQRSLPKSTWHKLVAELQVPLRLSITCKEAILLQLDAASTTSALSVLVTFLTSASDSEALLGRTTTSKLLLAIQQQVQQSGLLECLPQLYLSTAEALRSAATLRQHRSVKDPAKAAAGDTCSSSCCSTAAAQSSCTSTDDLGEGSDRVSADGSNVTDSDSTEDSGSSSSDSTVGDSGHLSISQLEAYSDVLLPLHVQLSKLFPSDVTSVEGSSRVPVRTSGASSLAACSIAAAQLVFAVLYHSAGPSASKQRTESYISMLDNLSDKAALALGALSGQLSVMVADAAPSLASLDSAAAQLLLSPNYILSLSYLTVLTGLTAMYVEEQDFEHIPGIQKQLVFNGRGGTPASASSTASSSSSSSSSCCCNGGSSNSTSTHSSRRSSASQSEDLQGVNADGDPGEQRLHEYGRHKLFPWLDKYHADMLKPFGISVPSLLWPAMLRPDSHAFIIYAAAAQGLLLADVSMLLVWMHSSDVQQYQRQAVQPHLQLMVQCLMLPCVLAQWAPGSSCHDLVIDTLSKLVQGVPSTTPPHSAADPVMSAGSSCDSVRAPQHNQVVSPRSSLAAAGGGDGKPKSEHQPLVVVGAQQITTQVLADHESFVRSLTKFDLLARKSHWMEAALRNIAALCCRVCENPFAYWAKVSGHNSPEEQQLHSLCCSMLKLSASRMSWRDSTANQLRWAAAACSAAVATAAILDNTDLTDEIYAALGVAAVEGNLDLTPSSSHCSPDNQAASSSGSTGCPYHDAASKYAAATAARLITVSSMPSLAIFGRCCLQASQQLKEQIPVILQQRLGLLQGQPMLRGQPGCPFPPQNLRPFTDAAGACVEPRKLPLTTDDPLGALSLMANTVMLLGIALKSDGVEVEGREMLLQELQQMSAAAMCAATTPQAPAAPLLALVKQLRATGLACCSHPVAPMCNNPSCSTTRGDTELGLVTGKSCMCGGCRVAHYCCRACQQEHWELHKPACKALVAAAAAAK